MKIYYNRPEEEFFFVTKQQLNYPEELTVALAEDVNITQQINTIELKDSIEDGTIISYEIYKNSKSELDPDDIENLIKCLDQLFNN